MIQNFGGHDEEVFDIFSGHGWRLEVEVDALFPFELFDSINTDFPLVLHIKFIANQKQDDIRLTLIHHFIVPRVQIVECFESGDVIRQKYAMSSSIEYFRNTFKWLLSRCVPYLKLKHLLLQFHE